MLPGDEERGRIANNASAQIKTGPGVDDTIRGLAAVNVKVEKPHGVTYEFEAGLPNDLQKYLPDADSTRYYAGDSVTVSDPKETSKTIGSTTYTFDGWYVNGGKVTGSTYTMDDRT